MRADPEDELREAIEQIVRSTSNKKLIVAGPGTGNTSVFRRLLEATRGERNTRLVLTFINNLKNDLDEGLHDLASVFTLHGYCQSDGRYAVVNVDKTYWGKVAM